MIHHFSFAAEDPPRVAAALAEILGGRAVPFLAHAGGFMALSGNAHGTAIEVYPLGIELTPDPQTGFAQFHHNDASSRHTATHAAISVPLPLQKILDLAQREGWRAQRTQRGPFDFVEFWVENRVMLELFPPELQIDWSRLRPPPARPQS